MMAHYLIVTINRSNFLFESINEIVIMKIDEEGFEIYPEVGIKSI